MSASPVDDVQFPQEMVGPIAMKIWNKVLSDIKLPSAKKNGGRSKT